MKRTLVLGAGGLAVIAWQTGVVAGLADAGVDVRGADLLIGTSAGACVAAQITSGLSLEMLFKRQSEPRLQTHDPAPDVDARQFVEDIAAARGEDGGREEVLKKIGALAVRAPTVSEAERRKMIAARLPIHDWPRHELQLIAVDVESGERRAFSRADGVPLVDAVAASCAVPGMWPPVTIEGRRYIDGGVYSADNADLALGARGVLVLTLAPASPPLSVVPIEPALDSLRGAGAEVAVIRPDEATITAFASSGGNLLDPSVRSIAARTGRAQGRLIAARLVAPLWN